MSHTAFRSGCDDTCHQKLAGSWINNAIVRSDIANGREVVEVLSACIHAGRVARNDFVVTTQLQNNNDRGVSSQVLAAWTMQHGMAMLARAGTAAYARQTFSTWALPDDALDEDQVNQDQTEIQLCWEDRVQISFRMASDLASRRPADSACQPFRAADSGSVFLICDFLAARAVPLVDRRQNGA